MLNKTIDGKASNWVSCGWVVTGVGELEKKVQQCDMSADELEQWAFWHQPEVGYHQILNKKKLRAAFCFVMACEKPVPHAK